MSNGIKKRAVILLAEDDPGDQKLTKMALSEGMIDNDIVCTYHLIMPNITT